MSINYKTVLNDKESIELAISLVIAGSYIQNKFRSNFKLNQIDWSSRKAVMSRLPEPMKIWISKSFINFAGTSLRLNQ